MPKRGSCGSVLPGCRLSKQYPSINSPAARCCTSRARRDAHCTLLGSPVCRDTPRLVLASRSRSRAAPTCAPHSARCSARCHTSRDFVPWRFLDAGQLSVRSVSRCRRRDRARRFPSRTITSGLPRQADRAAATQHFAFGPKHEVAALQPAAREQEPRGR